MHKIIIPLFVAATLLIFSGCSGKESILVPGQSESDCDESASKLGVCGTPKSVYKYKKNVKNLWFEDGVGYYVKKNGKIYNVDTHEEVIPGEKPSGCNNAICPNCDDKEESDGVYYGVNGYKKGVSVRNRSLIVDSPQKTTMIRDLGWQQKIWIAPMKTNGDDLVEAHGIHVVIKKPSWIIGEDVPKRTNRGIAVPSVMTKEVLYDNHRAISRKTNEKISDYIHTQKNSKLKKIEDYINVRKGLKKNDKK